ncbi:MAG TPA: septation protein SepH [Acidimicrobiia bacterium]|nr:septation protein SepH [Acidimicrobiia bacterium]
MPKLHLVGITPDHRGLVLSEHPRAKRGDMVLEIDDRLLEAIEKANRLRTLDEGHGLESAALPSKRNAVNGDTAVDRLAPREIQRRLRSGESITAMARSSGTDEAWIRRFAAPVLAEQARVIERARALTLTKRGVGPSGATLGPSVAANVIDRGVPLTLPDLDAAWGAYQRPEGGWHVTFTFPLRGRRQTAEWELDLATGDLAARNKLASELGWREPGKRLPQPAQTRPAATPAPAPKRPATRTTAAAPPVGAPASDTGPDAGSAASEPSPGDTAQSLPYGDSETEGRTGADTGGHPSGGLVRKAPPPARKAPAKKASTAPARKPAAPPAKRAAAAMTEAPAQSVVPVPDADAERDRPSGSMPPTDLDVVDVLGGYSPHDDDGPDTVIVLPVSSEDDAVEREQAAAPTEPEEHDGPTGPISLRIRPQPATAGPSAPGPGGPTA